MELFNKKGEKASMKEVCQWWVDKYPPDVFVFHPRTVIEIRNNCIIIINKLKR